MHYYISLTSKCNLNCKYCYGKSVDDFMSKDEEKMYDFEIPSDTIVKIEELKKLSDGDDDFVITFYGGEPLLKIQTIKNIMDNVNAKKFMIQTNAIFLNKLDKKYVNKFDTIFASIDGNKEHTDERRGNGVYDKVIENLKKIRQNGFDGEIIARMTVDETCDIYKNVNHLISNSDFNFSSIHWQIDAGFWKNDYISRNFLKWSLESYNTGIEMLVDEWINRIIKTREVLRIYPFVGIMHSLLTNEKALMRCGAGHKVLGIQTDGKIVACPITAGFKPLYMGDVKYSILKDIVKNKILPTGECLTCEIKDICGGRCLYSNKSKLWPESGRQQICNTIFFLVEKLKSKVDIIKDEIKKGNISYDDFYYPKYNGCEIIP